MGRIEKDKNLYKFWVDGKAKPYTIDINKGELLGLRGSPIQRFPTAVVELARYTGVKTSVLRLVVNGYPPSRTDLYQLADKLDAIGYSASTWELNNLSHKADEINFKDMAKYLKSGEGDIEDYIRHRMREMWLAKHNLRPTEQLTQPMIDLLYDYCSANNYTVEEISCFAYYLSRGLYEFFIAGNMFSRGTCASVLKEFAKCCRALETPMEKSDFFRQYINAQRNFERQKDVLLDKLIAENQRSKMSALAFENDEFQVIVPTTNKELITEGENQHNCVGGYGQRIAEGNRYVVFIRHKADPSTSYITCDILTDGRINQYLTRYNRYTGSESAKAFEKLYQEHLYANWGE